MSRRWETPDEKKEKKSAAIKGGTKNIVNRLNQQDKAVKRAKKRIAQKHPHVKKKKNKYIFINCGACTCIQTKKCMQKCIMA